MAWFKRKDSKRSSKRNVTFSDEDPSLVRVTTKSDNGSDEDESTELLITRQTSGSGDARVS